MTLLADLEEPTDVLAASHFTAASTLLDGIGGAVGVAAGGAVWRLLSRRQGTKRTRRQTERDEVATLRRIVDAILLWLTGRKGEEGLPDTDGFVVLYERSQTEIRESLTALHGAVGELQSSMEVLTAEWTPNGGQSSHDRLRRIDERGADDEARS